MNTIFLLRKKGIITILLFLPGLATAQLLNASLKKNTEEVTYKQALLETNRQNYPQAIILANKAVNESPRNADYNLLLGKLYIITKQYSLAKLYITKVIDRSPKYRDAYSCAISMELGAANLPEALRYANEGLDRFPEDFEFSIKKLSILDASQRFAPGDTLTEALSHRYPANPEVQKAATEHYREAGEYYKDRGFLAKSRLYFEHILTLCPNNDEAMGALSGLSIQAGDYPAALLQVTAGLSKHPTSYELLMKKLSLLQLMHRYTDALDVLKLLKTTYPRDSKVRALSVSLRLEASRYYEQTDPYVLYQSVLAANPGNREALGRLISISMDRGVYHNALAWINKGLRQLPGDVALLSKKADVLEILGNKTEAAAIIMAMRTKNPSSKALASRATDLEIASGKIYFDDHVYDKAIHNFEAALHIAPANIDAENYLANVYIEQKDYNNALKTIDTALRYHKDDEHLLLKQASVLSDAGRYNESFQILGKLIRQHPDNVKYKTTLTDQQLQAGRRLMNNEETDQAIKQFKEVLLLSPGNRDALNYIINLESGVGMPDTALAYTAVALKYYPGDKDFLLKQSSVLTELKEYHKAAAIAASLMDKYPFNKTYRAAYIDNLLASGSASQKAGNTDSALADYKMILAVAPYDTLALYAAINIDNAHKEYDSALALIDKGLVQYNNNVHLREQRVYTLESKGMYAEAAEENDRLVLVSPSAQNTDHGNYLKSKLMNNQFGLYYLQSTYHGKANYSYRIGVAEYRHFYRKGSYAARINYAVKDARVGMQYEGDLYYNHTKKVYSYAYVSYSGANLVFPRLRLGYSLFEELPRGFALETGIRYTTFRTTDSISAISSSLAPGIFTEEANIYSGVIGLAQSAGDFWFNVHGYFIYDYPRSTMSIKDAAGQTTEMPTIDKPHFYQAYQGVVRYYMNSRKEFMSLTGGAGTSPDDRTRIMLLPQLTGNLLSRYVNLGYQKCFKYRTTIGASAGLNNYRINENSYQNQFDLYLFLTRKL